jgi:hypothetical protein
MKKLLVVLALFFVSPALAQTGSAKSVSTLNAEVNSLWPDNTSGIITPFNARQTLLDLIASYFNTAGLTATGTGNPVLATAPTISAPTLTGTTTVTQINASPWPTNLLLSSAAPTIGSCGGGTPAITANNGTAAFTVTVGSSATSCAVGLPTATTGWNCHADDVTTQSTTVFLTRQTATSQSGATFKNYNTAGANAAWATSDVLLVTCSAV